MAWATGKLKYSLNIQKPGSFTWEANTLPDDTARTIISGVTPEAATKGKTSPPAIIYIGFLTLLNPYPIEAVIRHPTPTIKSNHHAHLGVFLFFSNQLFFRIE